MDFSLIITCEHAGNDIPQEYATLFSGHQAVVDSHQGWDPGAYAIAEYLAENLSVSVYACHTTRLLVEANRSIDNPQLFSQFSRHLSEDEKNRVLAEIYTPYRQAVESEIKQLAKPVLHLSIHSFTPVWNGQERQVDLGLLFDPARDHENRFCHRYKVQLEKVLPDLHIKFNEPYLGIDDGFTSYLRTKLSDEEYLGIEIEINQKLVEKPEYLTIQSALLQATLNSANF